MTTLVLEKQLEIEIPVSDKETRLPNQDIKITPAYAERIARRFGIDLKKVGLPNYTDNHEEEFSYLRGFTNLEIKEVNVNGRKRKVMTGTYVVQTFVPTIDNRVISLAPESFYFIAD